MKNTTLTLPIQLRTVALVTALALLAWTIGLPAWIHQANAANVDEFSDTLSDSDLGLPSVHTLVFGLNTTIAASETLRVTFDSVGQAFDLTALTNGDVTISAVSGGTINQVASVAACSGATNEIYVSNIDTTNDYVELTVCTGDSIDAGTVTEIVVGSTNFIVNPVAEGSYVVSIGGTMTDTGDTRVAIIDDVTVTAAVDTIFSFSINGVAGGKTVNDDVTTTFASSTATTVPFGIIAPDTPKLMAQELRVDTNALNGFSVSVFADQTLTAGNGATIDPYIDGSELEVPDTWNGPAGTLGLTDTYGHWGLTSDDDVVSSSTAPGLWGSGIANYVGNFINNPVEVFYNNTPVEFDQGGMGVGSTTVAYKVEISNLQEAAKDYTATLTYIATPVF